MDAHDIPGGTSLTHDPPPAAHSVGFLDAARYWLELGLISFGGPAGQVSLMHSEVVERRRWLSERRFLHALNYAMVLPGPEAQQLATYVGWLLHGIPGGLVAGSLFILPSLLLLIVLAGVYALWGQVPILAAVFWALKPAVTAIVVQAVWRLGNRILHNGALLAIAVLAFLGLTVVRVPYPALIAAAALVGWLGSRWRPRLFTPPSASHSAAAKATTQNPGTEPSAHERSLVPPLHGDDTPTPEHSRFSRRRLGLILLGGLVALVVPLALVSLAGGWDGLLATMARFFSRVALLSFGGAYAVLPYVAQGAVQQHQWLGADQMIDGLALGETTPGPLIMVVTFVGFMGGWNSSGSLGLALAAALTVTWFTFLPSFLFILAGGPLVEASRENLRLGGPLTAISAAVVGVVGNLAVFFAWHVLWPDGFSGGFLRSLDWPALLLMLAAGWALIRWRWPAVRVIAIAALIGLVRQLLLPLAGAA